jgi:hypothetical protein
VYSLFYRTFGPDSAKPACGATVDPLIALNVRVPKYRLPDPHSFIADSFGGAFCQAGVFGRLLDAQSPQVAVIYASDGKTCGPVSRPGRPSTTVGRASASIRATVPDHPDVST